MNRRNLFQSIIAGIVALVGYKYLPKAKAKLLKPIDFDDFRPEDCSHIEYQQLIDDYTPTVDSWIIATKEKDGIVRQCRYGIEPDGSIIVDWYKCVQLKDNNPNTTVEIQMNDYEQFLSELVRSAGGEPNTERSENG